MVPVRYSPRCKDRIASYKNPHGIELVRCADRPVIPFGARLVAEADEEAQGETADGGGNGDDVEKYQAPRQPRVQGSVFLARSPLETDVEEGEDDDPASLCAENCVSL